MMTSALALRASPSAAWQMASGVAHADEESEGHSHVGQKATLKLVVGAVGIVFGDIGTSPLYAFKEAFGGAHALPLSEANVLGVLSLIFWAVMLIVSVKYVSFVLRFDNKGEGGVLALLALASQLFRGNRKLAGAATVIAVFFIPMFYYVIEVMSDKFSRRGKKAEMAEAGGAAVGGTPVQPIPHAPREDD